MIDFARVDQILAFAPADVEAVPLVAVERKSGDGERLALRAGFLDPVIQSAGRVFAVSHLRNNALKAGTADVLVHLLTVDLETLAELDCGVAISFFRSSLRWKRGSFRRSYPLR